MKKLFILAVISASFCSCSNFYKTLATNGSPTATRMKDLKKQQKYFILRDSTAGYAMTNVSISADGKNIESDLVSIPDQHMTHMWKPKGEKLKYDKADADYVLHEVHLYSSPDSSRGPGHYSLPINMVQKTEVLQKDIDKTSRNHATAIILGVAGAAAILTIVGVAVAAAAWSTIL